MTGKVHTPMPLGKRFTWLFTKKGLPSLVATLVGVSAGWFIHGAVGLVLSVAAGILVMMAFKKQPIRFTPWQALVTDISPIVAKMCFMMVILLPVMGYMTLPTGHTPDTLTKYVSILFALPKNLVSGAPANDVFPGIPIVVLLSVALMVWGSMNLDRIKMWIIALVGLLLFTLSPSIAAASHGHPNLRLDFSLYSIGYFLAWFGLILIMVSRLLPKILKTTPAPTVETDILNFLPPIVVAGLFSQHGFTISGGIHLPLLGSLDFESMHHGIAAGLSAGLAGLGGGAITEESGDEEGKKDPTAKMRITVTPEGTKILKCDEDPVGVFAQILNISDLGQESLDTEGTQSITFTLLEGGPWVTMGTDVAEGDGWKGASLTASKPEGDFPAPPPDRVRVKASGFHNGKPVSKILSMAFEAPATLVLKPYDAKFLSKSGKVFEVAYSIKGGSPGTTKWSVEATLDTDAVRLCSSVVKPDAKDPASGKITITEDDTETEKSSSMSNYYSTGLIKVNAERGDQRLSESIKVTVYREGLYIHTPPGRVSNKVVVEAAPDQTGKLKPPAEVDLCLLLWDKEKQDLVSKSSLISSSLDPAKPSANDVDAEDEATNAFIAGHFSMAFDRIRPSNLSTAVYKVSVDRILPGAEGLSYKGSIPVSVTVGDNTYETVIPVEIKPATLPGTTLWDEAYKNCVHIIKTYMPENLQQERLDRLEKSKNAMGVEDLNNFRRRCWVIAEMALTEDAKAAAEDAAAWNRALEMAQLVKWAAKEAFDIAAEEAFGPVGKFLASQVYVSVTESIETIADRWEEDWYTLAKDIAYERLSGFVSDGASEAFSKAKEHVFGESTGAKWLVQYTVMQFFSHWYSDRDPQGKRKGIQAAIKATGIDLAGEAFKKGFKEMLGKALEKGIINKDKFEAPEKWLKEKLKTKDDAGKETTIVEYYLDQFKEYVEEFHINITF